MSYYHVDTPCHSSVAVSVWHRHSAASFKLLGPVDHPEQVISQEKSSDGFDKRDTPCLRVTTVPPLGNDEHVDQPAPPLNKIHSKGMKKPPSAADQKRIIRVPFAGRKSAALQLAKKSCGEALSLFSAHPPSRGTNCTSAHLVLFKCVLLRNARCSGTLSHPIQERGDTQISSHFRFTFFYLLLLKHFVIQISNHPKPRLPDEPQFSFPLSPLPSTTAALHRKTELSSLSQSFPFEIRGKRSVPQIDILGRH